MNPRIPFGRPLLPLVLLFVLGAAVIGAWQGLREGEDHLIQRRYTEAVTSLEGTLAEMAVDAPERDRVLYLLGKARFFAGNMPGSVESFSQLTAEHPESRWRHRAAFGKADTLKRQGKLREAAMVYRDEIARLVGLDRKEDVAQVYLGLAERALAKEKPEHTRAVTFFDLALELGLEPGKAANTRLQAAEAMLAQGDSANAVQRFQPLLKVFEPGDARWRAMLGLGRARLAVRDMAGARTVLRDLRSAAPDASQAADAAYEIARSFGVPSPGSSQLDRAVRALQVLAAEHADHPKAEIADFLMAQCYQSVGRIDDALGSLRKFLEERGDSGKDEVAQARALIGDLLLGQEKIPQAIEAWRAYLAQHPAHDAWTRVQRAIVDAEFAIAEAALKLGSDASPATAKAAAGFDRARELFAEFTRAHPLDSRNPRIALVRGRMMQQEEKFDAAREAYQRTVSKYPGTEEASEAQYRIGWIYENKTFDYLAALASYRKVNWGSHAGQAHGRISKLEEKSLELCTDRTWRSDEQAAFKIRSRNVETVRVRIYRLDLEDYFRATHTSGSIERLDIEVIEPDATFDSSIKGYQRHQETERAVAIETDGAGAYVVKVDDGEFEATTLVLVTDLAMIAKSSRHELFIFTQNTKEQRPESGVRVMISDGKKIVHEGVTSDDGVFRYQGDDLKNQDQLTVFAVNGAGSGASSINLNGMGFSEGLSTKAMLFTDRPGYQPGQIVHMKGIVREVQNGLYKLPTAGAWRVNVQDSGGKQIRSEDVKFTDFGTFALDVVLPAEAALGDWQLVARPLDAQGRPGSGNSFSHSFTVAKYERPRLTLVGKPERAVVFRGEPIEGTFELSWFFGGPAIGKDVVVTMSMPDGRVIRRELITNAAGEVAFMFDSAEFPEEGVAHLQASVPAENISSVLIVPVVTTEFEPKVKLLREVYLAGETLVPEVKIVDRSGKPLAHDGEAILSRKENKGGRVVEVEVFRHAFRTDKEGKASPEIALDPALLQVESGSRFRLRVEATDRFGTLVAAAADFTISGDDDAVKLRILADRTRYQVGDTLRVRVVNRAGEKLTLQTIQGDGILSYQTRLLPAGESVVEFPLEALHAPNFALALAMIDESKLQTAETPFDVTRGLNLEVTLPATARPGAEVEVGLKTVGPDGQPVAAEVAVALVDEALLALYPSRVPAMNSVFWSARRETAFRTVSSCTWSYTGTTSKISEAVIAEVLRNEMAKELAAAIDLAQSPEATSAFRARVGMVRESMDEIEESETAFDSISWNSAVGIGGGAGGKFGGRQGGRLAAPGADPVLRVSPFLPSSRDQVRFGFLGTEVRAFNDQHDGGVRNTFLTMATNEPREEFSATGGWLSAVVTGADGTGKATIKLPDDTTGWKLTARGVTTTTTVGEAEASMKTVLPLQAELDLPRILVEGDTVRVEGHVINTSAADAVADFSVVVRAKGENTAAFEERKTSESVNLKAGSESTVTMELPSMPVGNYELRMSVANGGGDQDELVRPLAVVPFGSERRASAAGMTGESDGAALALPPLQDAQYQARSMVITVGPDPASDLMASALGFGFRPMRCGVIDRTNMAISSRILAVAAVLESMDATGGSNAMQRGRLDSALNGGVLRLIGVQRPDGSFGWIGTDRHDSQTTAQALRALAVASRLGVGVAQEPANKAAEWCLQTLRSAEPASRADLLHGLATLGRAPFETANTLQRGLANLTLESRARLALAWLSMKRPELATEIVAGFATELAVLQPARPGMLEGPLPRVSNPQLPTGGATRVVELGLAAQAVLRTERTAPLGKTLTDWLSSARVGASWGTPSATSAALGALALQRQVRGGSVRPAKVVVTVNGKEVQTFEAKDAGTTQMVAVPQSALEGQTKHRVEVRADGAGAAVYWTAVLSGFAPGFDTKTRNYGLIRVDREYLQDHLRFADRDVQTGFSVVTGSNIKTWKHLATQVQIGEIVRVHTRFYARNSQVLMAVSPFVLEEPIPAGCAVARDSIVGNFERVEVQPDRLVFWYRRGITSANVQYELQAQHAGAFRALATEVYASVRPSMQAFSEPTSLTIHPKGAGARDERRLTPDELYYLGKGAFEAGFNNDEVVDRAMVDAAWGHFTKLIAEWHTNSTRIREGHYKELAKMMLYLSIERGDSARTVRFFEELKDLWPELVIPFHQIVSVGRAYVDLGEFEAALLVFRATAEASFLEEAAVSTTLQGLGELRASVSFLSDLLLDYPELNVIRESRYGIGQKLASRAAAMQLGTRVDERIGSKVMLWTAALENLREFLVLYPEDPSADEVSFALATTYLEGKDVKDALATADAALKRYTNSAFEDDLLYTKGWALFESGKADEAFEVLKQVATGTFTQPNGSRGPSDSAKYAVYLQAQIHHSLGRIEEALATYDEVEDRFIDAEEAADYFRRKSLGLPEATTVALDAQPKIELTYRNVPSVELQVYRVDLMRLYLLEKSLNDFQGIQLYGIRPFLERTVELGDGRDYRSKTKEITFDLEKPGAYLVVVRGGDELASGMLLRSDLTVEVQEELTAGRARVNVKSGAGFVGDAHVKVIGSGDEVFRSGDTDLRGVHVAEGLVGMATVIVKKGDDYAFYRGKGIHQPSNYRPPAPVQFEAGPGKDYKADVRFDALEQNFSLNRYNRDNQVEWLDKKVQRKGAPQRGVQVQSAK